MQCLVYANDDWMGAGDKETIKTKEQRERERQAQSDCMLTVDLYPLVDEGVYGVPDSFCRTFWCCSFCLLRCNLSCSSIVAGNGFSWIGKQHTSARAWHAT